MAEPELRMGYRPSYRVLEEEAWAFALRAPGLARSVPRQCSDIVRL